MTQLESDIERRLVELIKEHGGRCLKLKLASGRGFPDRTILLPGGRIIFVELKKPGGVVSRHQRDWHGVLRLLGFKVYVIDSIEDAEHYLG